MLYKFRSMSGHIITRCGIPLSWKSLQQCQTSLSSAESEIMATNECVKDTISLRHRASDLYMTEIDLPTVVYKNNRACCDRAKTKTTKGLKHLNLRRELFPKMPTRGLLSPDKTHCRQHQLHLFFMKELCNSNHFRTLRNSFMCSCKSFLE